MGSLLKWNILTWNLILVASPVSGFWGKFRVRTSSDKVRLRWQWQAERWPVDRFGQILISHSDKSKFLILTNPNLGKVWILVHISALLPNPATQPVALASSKIRMKRQNVKYKLSCKATFGFSWIKGRYSWLGWLGFFIVIVIVICVIVFVIVIVIVFLIKAGRNEVGGKLWLNQTSVGLASLVTQTHRTDIEWW